MSFTGLTKASDGATLGEDPIWWDGIPRPKEREGTAVVAANAPARCQRARPNAPRRGRAAAVVAIACALLWVTPAVAASEQPVPDPAPGTTPSPDPAPGAPSHKQAAPPAPTTPKQTQTHTAPTQTTPTQTMPTQTTPAPTVTSPYVQTTPVTAGASAAAAARPQARQPRTTARSPSAGAANRDASAAKPISRRSQVAVPPRPDAATMRSALPVRDTGARGGGRPERVLLPAALSLWLVLLAGGSLLWRTAHVQRRTGWR